MAGFVFIKNGPIKTIGLVNDKKNYNKIFSHKFLFTEDRNENFAHRNLMHYSG